MFAAILAGFGAAFLAPLVHRLHPRRSGWLCALAPLVLSGFFVSRIGAVAAGEPEREAWDWIPSLGVDLSFRMDGLGLMFALLISGIGALVIVYASAYLHGHRHLGRFYGLILAFMASMLGAVLADNLITLFVFWELTSLSSYFLIGFEHEREAARKAALQALLVTALGGLAMLAGFLLLAKAGGSYELSALLSKGEDIRAHGLYLPILLLVLAGAFTKSAQFPFHFWLPSAMEAPAPVSAYLHSATMVKLGIYLLARLSPLLGGTEAWQHLLVGTGAATMLTGALLALLQTDLKRILAYSTVSSLGTVTLLLGLHTEAAARAAMVYLLAHALYKGALFLVAGAVDHETGVRDFERLGGLYRAMPVIALAAVVAAFSMAGLPPLFGFIAKESLYEAELHGSYAPFLITGASVLANGLLVAVAAMAGMRPFFGRAAEAAKKAIHLPAGLWLGPLLLSLAGPAIGLAPDGVARQILSPAAGAVRGEAVAVELALWHGATPAFLLGVITLLCGAGMYAGRSAFCRGVRGWNAAGWGPLRCYELLLDGMLRFARLQTRCLQNGYLRYYLMTVLGAAFLLVLYSLAAKAGLRWTARWPEAMFHEWLIAAMILAAALVAATSLSRLATVAALGVVGYGVALIYILFGAPDLAMTQFCVETLSIILFVLVLYRLPRFSILSGRGARTRDVLVALGSGGIMTALVLTAVSEPARSGIGRFFAENALLRAHGHNVVNVILVDFRGLDTLGEITVLAAASLGVYALLKGSAGGEDK